MEGQVEEERVGDRAMIEKKAILKKNGIIEVNRLGKFLIVGILGSQNSL
jgi:hypothetical protein